MMAKPDNPNRWVEVTSRDPITGEEQTGILNPHSYILVVGEFCEISSCQRYGNGTVQLTLKQKKAVEGQVIG